MTELANAEWISGFWRRIGAFAIDTTILGLVGIGLGLFVERQFVELGGYGRFVGFFIALFYFGVLNSKIFEGQTVGKKLLAIRVVNASNEPIDVLHSFARYGVLGVPFFLNGARLTNEAMTSFWLYPISLIIFGGLLSVTYLYIFNRVTRQSLHDLVVGTFVVNADAEKSAAGPLWRPHLVVVGVLFIAAAAVPVFTSSLAQREPFNYLLSVQAGLIEHPSVNYVVVSSRTTTGLFTSNGTMTTRYLSARAFLGNANISDAELAKELATKLAETHSNSQQFDVIQIILTYGYDIGIASSWSNYSYNFKPAELIDGV